MAFCDPKQVVAQLHLEPGMVVADFGSGAGYMGVVASECVGETGTVYLIDIQQELLTKATHLSKGPHMSSLVYVHGDLEKEGGSTLEDHSVDMVIMSNFLFQVEKKEMVLREAHRILHKGGTLLIVDWRDSFGGIGPQPREVYDEEDARTLATRVGFTCTHNIDAGEYHYGLVCNV